MTKLGVPRRTVLAGVLTAVLGVATAMLAGCGAASSDSNPGAEAQMIVYPAGKRPAAPPLSGELLGGGSFDLADHAGQVTVVNFWGSWCAPCRLEAPRLERIYQETRDKGVVFIGVNVRDQRDPALAFVKEHNGYPSIFDPSSRLVLRFDVPPAATPSTVLIDRAGRIAAVIPRVVGEQELRALVTGLLAEGPGGSPASSASPAAGTGSSTPTGPPPSAAAPSATPTGQAG